MHRGHLKEPIYMLSLEGHLRLDFPLKDTDLAVLIN